MEKFEILSDAKHIRLRANLYAGSINTQDSKVLIDGSFTQMPLNEGLLKICSEILDNSIDAAVRANFKKGNKIDVVVSADRYTVTDNGSGIPVELIVTPDGKKIYRPVAAWGMARAGSNFDDSKRASIGSNGLGSYLANVLSKSFIGVSCDGKNCLTHEASMGEVKNIDVVASKRASGVSVTIIPDFEFFSMTHFDENHIKFLHERVRGLSVAFPDIRFTFTGTLIKIKKPEDYYTTLYSIRLNDNTWFGLAKSNGSFETSSIVNGLIVPNGGSHIDYFVNGVTNELSALLKRRKKVDIPASKLKSYLNCFSVITGFIALKFDSQTKTKITNSVTEIKNHVGEVDFSKIAAALLKQEDLISDILAYTKFQEDLEAKKVLDKLEKPKKRIILPNVLYAVGKMKRLFLVEGLSAMSGLSPAFGRQGNAYFALKGVPMNGYECSHQEMAANKEFGALYTLIKSEENLEIVIAADSDADGNHIRGLLVAFFYRYVPDLFEQKRVFMLSTPIAVEYNKKNQPAKWVYSFNEIGTLRGDVRYQKGLGSWTAESLKPVIQKDGFDNMVRPVTSPTKEELDAWFIGGNADVRKQLIQESPAFDIMSL